MKKKLFIIPLAAFMVAGAVGMSACGKIERDEPVQPSDDTKTLVNIAVDTPPTKTVYVDGDSFDPTGLKIKATYTDGSSEIVNGWTVNKTTLTVSDNSVTISYTKDNVTLTTVISITVNPKADPGTKTLTGIAITTQPTKTHYDVGEVFDKAGMVVTAIYSNSDIADVTEHVTTDKDGVPLTTDDKFITVSYTEGGLTCTDTVDIAVGGEPTPPGPEHAGTLEDPLTTAEAVTIANGLAETTDSKNPIASEGMYVKGVVTEFKETFSADYGNYSIVIGGDFTLWRIKNGPEFAKFNAGDIEVGDEVTAFVYIMNFKGTPESTSNSYVHSVQKAGDTKTLQSIEIVGSLTKTSYVEGQTYSSAGLSVKGHYDDGSEGTVAATITLNKTTAALGDTEIIASAEYNGKTAEPKTFTISVAEGQIKNYGTEQAPLTVSQALALITEECTEDKAMTAQAITVQGQITEIKNTFTYESGPCFEFNISDGTSTVYVYRCHCTEQQKTNVVVGATVKLVGYAKNFKGTLEFVDNGASQCHILAVESNVPDKELSSISIEGVLVKTTYTEGEAYSAEGLSVKGHYSDGSSADVSATITLDKTTAAIGDTEIVASAEFNGKTATKNLAVTVNAKKIVTGITLSEEHRTFDQYAEFVKETVTATFTVGNPEIVEATFSNPDMTTAGEKTITVSYTDAYGNVVSTSYKITVVEAKEPELINIAIDGSLAKSEYKVGETYSTEGLSVLGYYDNETTKVLTATITFNKTTAALGDTSIIASVEYGDFSDEKEFDVTVTKVDENTIDVSGVDSYSISADDLGLDGYGSGSNTNFAWTDLAKHTSGTLQGNHKTGDSPRDSELHNVRAFSKNITYIKFNIGFAAGDAATGAIRFGTSALPTSNSTAIGANTNYALNKVGDFIVSATPGCGYFSLKWTKGASYYTSIEVHFDEYKADGVQGVSLNKTATTLAVGANETLTATVSPASATNKQVTWLSSAPAVATVDSNGKVTAVAEGTAIITVTTVDGSKTATCTVTVTSEGGGGGSETTSTPIDLGGDSKVVFGGVTYEKSIKTGTGSAAGSTSIKVPSGAKKLVFFAAGWNKENVTISVTGGGISKSLKLTSDTGVSGNGPTYTLASSTEASFKFEIDVSSLSGETTLALAATAGKRFVVWNASYTK